VIVANSALMLRSDAKSIASRSMLQFTRSFVQAGASFDKAQDEVEGIGLGVTKKTSAGGSRKDRRVRRTPPLAAVPLALRVSAV
jgi:hypothetical protein